MTADEFIRRFRRPAPSLASLLDAAFEVTDGRFDACHALPDPDREAVLAWAAEFVRGVVAPPQHPEAGRSVELPAIALPRSRYAADATLTPDEAASVAWLADELARSGVADDRLAAYRSANDIEDPDRCP